MPAFLFDGAKDDDEEALDAPPHGGLRRSIDRIDASIRGAINSSSEPLAFRVGRGLAQGVGGAAVNTFDLVLDSVEYPIENAARGLGATEFADSFRRRDEDRRRLRRLVNPDPEFEPVESFVAPIAGVLASVVVGRGVGASAGASGVALELSGAAAGGLEIGKQTSDQLVEAGVDPGTAGFAGLRSGLVGAAGVLAPGSLGGSLLSRVASGAGLNVAFGVGDRYLTQGYLQSVGYPEQAKMFEALAIEALATDIILGAGFGAIDVGGRPLDGRFRELIGREPTVEEIDAALTLAGRLQVDGAAPGVPRDGLAITTHQRALDLAAEQLIDGEPVNVDALFAPRTRLEGMEPADILELARDAGNDGDDLDAAALALLARERGAFPEEADEIIRVAQEELGPEGFERLVEARAREIEQEQVGPEFFAPPDDLRHAVLDALNATPEYAEAVALLRANDAGRAEEDRNGLFASQRSVPEGETLPGSFATGGVSYSGRRAKRVRRLVLQHARGSVLKPDEIAVLTEAGMLQDGTLTPEAEAMFAALEAQRLAAQGRTPFEAHMQAYAKAEIARAARNRQRTEQRAVEPASLISPLGVKVARFERRFLDLIDTRDLILEMSDGAQSSTAVFDALGVEFLDSIEARGLSESYVRKILIEWMRIIRDSVVQARQTGALDTLANRIGVTPDVLDAAAPIRPPKPEPEPKTPRPDTRARNAQIVELHRRGLSDPEIANALRETFPEITRAAVAGVLFRQRPSENLLASITVGKPFQSVIATDDRRGIGPEDRSGDGADFGAPGDAGGLRPAVVERGARIRAAQAEFGTGTSFVDSGYVLPDGSLLKVPPGEHETVRLALDDAVQDNPIGAMLADGAVRVNSLGATLAARPTNRQLTKLVAEWNRTMGRGAPMALEVVDPNTGAVLAARRFERVNLEAVDAWLEVAAPRIEDLLASQRERVLDDIGFFSAVEESVANLPLERWSMGWAAVRNSVAKGRGVAGYAGRVADEIKYLGLDDAFKGSKLKGEELRRAVTEYVELHKLVLQERYNSFDPVTAADAGIRRGPGDLRLPGEDPVFELRLKLPPGVPGSNFKSHWSRAPSNDDGVLVSVRGEYRIDDQGRRTLFGGEVQSDMAQVGRLAGALRELEERARPPKRKPPLTERTSQWTNAAVRAMVFRAARDGFDSVSFPTGETSRLIQGNGAAAAHYDTNVKGALEKVAALLGGRVREGGVEYGESDPLEPSGGDGGDLRVVWKGTQNDVDSRRRYETMEEAEHAVRTVFEYTGERAEVLGVERSTKAGTASAYVLDITPDMREQIVRDGFPLFSRAQGGGASARIATERLKADLARAFGVRPEVIDRLLETGQLSVFEDAGDALAQLGDKLSPAERAAISGGDLGGGYFGGDRAFIIASNVVPEQAYRVVLHEVGVHMGMPAMLGKTRFAQLRASVDALLPGEVRESEQFKALVADLRGAGQRGGSPNAVLQAFPDANPLVVRAFAEAEAFALKPEQRAEEAIAYLVENAPDLPLVRRILAAVRQWLWRTFGPEFGPNLTVDDLQMMAVAALRRESRLAKRNAAVREASENGALPSARADGYEGSDTGEAIEWLRAKAKGLDMSTEARMARARNMGFQTDLVLYHGTQATFSEFKISVDGINGPGVYLTASPKTAHIYADAPPVRIRESRSHSQVDGDDAVGNIIPVLIRGRIESKKADWRSARQKKFDGIRIGNTYVVFDPRNIRSVHAAFDPDHQNSPSLLATFPTARTPEQRVRLAEQLQLEDGQGRSRYLWRRGENEMALEIKPGETAGSDGAARVVFGAIEEDGEVGFGRSTTDAIEAERTLSLVMSGLERDAATRRREAYVFQAADEALGRLYDRLLSRMGAPAGYVVARHRSMTALVRADVASRYASLEQAAEGMMLSSRQSSPLNRAMRRVEGEDLTAAARSNFGAPTQEVDPDMRAALEIARNDPELQVPVASLGLGEAVLRRLRDPSARSESLFDQLGARRAIEVAQLQKQGATDLESAFLAASECVAAHGFLTPAAAAVVATSATSTTWGPLLTGATLVAAATTYGGEEAYELLWNIFGRDEDTWLPRDVKEVRRYFGVGDRLSGLENVLPAGPQRILRRAELDALALSDLSFFIPEDSDPTAIANQMGRMMGVDGAYLAQLVRKESAGKTDARPIDPRTGKPLSSALGVTQFLEGEWLKKVARYGPAHGWSGDLTTEQGRADALALREDPRWSVAMGAHLARENAEMLERRLRRKPTAQEVYLAHFAGISSAADLIETAEQNPGAHAWLAVPGRVSEANPSVFWDSNGQPRTVREVIDRLTKGFSSATFSLRAAPQADTLFANAHRSRGASVDPTP